MEVTGRNHLIIHDVLVGQAWLISGQSNAEFMLKESASASQEIAASANPLLRHFKIEKKTYDVPQESAHGAWVLAALETSGDFSAVGYYFAKKIQHETKQPVGIINGSWGGTFIEAWMSEQALELTPDLRAGETARRDLMSRYVPQKAAYVKAFGDWLKAHDRADKPCANPAAYARADVDTTDWKPITLPGKVASPELPTCGVIWIRKEIEVPQAVQGLVIKATLGRLTCFEETYWNGHRIFEMPYTRLPGEDYIHYFAIPQADVRPGKAIFAVRLYAPVHAPALATPESRFTIGPIPLAGPWLAKAEYRLPDLSAEEAAAVPKLPAQPPSLKASGIYNGVLNPLIPAKIAGILWYQGESNTGIAFQYRHTLRSFITDLRQKWQDPHLPFYIAQLPNYLPKQAAPGESAWAELRESQDHALALPDTAEAVLIDLGEANDIHPRNKADAADRLARIALARQYGQSKLISSGPRYESMKVEGNQIRLQFTDMADGLVAKPPPKIYDVKSLLNQTAPLQRNNPNSQLEGFAICGADHRWVWADAKIEGNTVLVSSEKVPAPVAVRYAWADNPTCNLTNSAGLPAAPFRTDSFPVSTEAYRFGLSPQGRF